MHTKFALQLNLLFILHILLFGLQSDGKLDLE